MKQLFFSLLIFLPNFCWGQIFFNPYYPYNSYEEQQQALRSAYENGQRMMEKLSKEYQEQASIDMLMGNYVEIMALGQYEKAYKKIEYIAENREYNEAWFYIGVMNELGLGTSLSYNYAKLCYSNGADLGSDICKKSLRRINNGNYLNTNDKNNFIQYFKNIYYIGIQAKLDWDIDTSASSSHSNSGTCYSCHGTGINPTPNSGGSRTSWTAYYNSDDSKCPYCGHYYKHFHDKCSSCNVPRQ